MNAKPSLKIAIVDFWKRATTDELERYLAPFRHWFNVSIDQKNPDIVLYSCFGEKHIHYNCKRVFICGESVVPDFNTCDYSISTVKIDYAGRNLWIPEAYFSQSTQKVAHEITQELTKRKFCSFIYSQENIGYGAKYRKTFCEKLMQYQHVDCPGKVLHNLDSPELSARHNGSWHQSKIHFLSKYKFNIAFENAEAPGYITEKLVDCYMANTVPIYWGSRGDISPYPKESMIYANDFNSIDDLIAKIKEVNENDDLYLNILRANPFRKENFGKLPDFHQQLLEFAKSIVESTDDTLAHRYEMTDSYRYAEFLKHKFWNSLKSIFQSK